MNIYMKITLVSNSRFDYICWVHILIFFLNTDTYAFSMCSFVLHFCLIWLIFFFLLYHSVHSWPRVLSSFFSLDSDTLLLQIWFAQRLFKILHLFVWFCHSLKVWHLIMSVWRRPTLFRSWSLWQISKSEQRQEKTKPSLF